MKRLDKTPKYSGVEIIENGMFCILLHIYYMFASSVIYTFCFRHKGLKIVFVFGLL